MENEKEILDKLDRILAILGEGRGRSTADLRRQAEADVIRLTELRQKRKKGHVREIEDKQ